MAHLKPPISSILEAKTEVEARWIVFPQYDEDQKELLVESFPKGEAVLRLAENSFNYNVLSGAAFKTVCDLVESCDCNKLRYSNLRNAVEMFSDWAERG